MQPIITSTIYLLAILVPLTFTTINSELFEFPKFILLLSGALIILTAWIIHAFKNKDYRLSSAKFSGITYSVLAVLFSQSLATIFSINQYTSFWGYYSRFHGGLLTTICYTIIYFAIIKWMDTRSTQKLIKISVITSFLIGLYAIAEHFGIDKNYWVQDVASRPFSTLGQPNWLAAYIIPNLFLTLYLSSIEKAKKSPYLFIIFVTLLIALFFTKSRSGLIGFAISFVTYYLLLARQFSFSKNKKSIILYSSILLLTTAFIGTPFTPKLKDYIEKKTISSTEVSVPSGTALENGGTESGDIRKIVWTGAIKLIQKHPYLGTGPETFAYTYYWERPTLHNMTSEWDFLYNKAHNEYLNIAAGSGIIGLLAYLYFHFAIFGTSLATIPRTKKVSQDKEDNLRYLYPVLGASVLGFAITNFFGFSVIPVYLLMTLIAALPTSILNESISSDPKSTPLDPIVFIIPLILFYPLKIFLADIDYAKGKKYLDIGQVATALPILQKATESRPGLDLFHATISEAYAAVGLKDKALLEVDINRQLNPYHLNFYKSRAKVYLTLAGVDPKYHAQAAQELIKARSLAPTDPKLAYNLGLVYTRLDDLKNAEIQLKDAIELKPNYGEPYYALTLLYEQSKQTNLIPDLMSQAKSNLATYSALLKEKIGKYANH